MWNISKLILGFCKRDDAGLSNSGLAGLSIITTDYVCTIARYGTGRKKALLRPQPISLRPARHMRLRRNA